jgi:hypothetical protein
VVSIAELIAPRSPAGLRQQGNVVFQRAKMPQERSGANVADKGKLWLNQVLSLESAWEWIEIKRMGRGT